MQSLPRALCSQWKTNQMLKEIQRCQRGKEGITITEEVQNHNFLILVLINIYPYIKLFLGDLPCNQKRLQHKGSLESFDKALFLFPSPPPSLLSWIFHYNSTKLLRIHIFQKPVSFYILKSLGVCKHFFLQISPVYLRNILLYFFNCRTSFFFNFVTSSQQVYQNFSYCGPQEYTLRFSRRALKRKRCSKKGKSYMFKDFWKVAAYNISHLEIPGAHNYI